jgi:transcriptional regulator NrdR family protein
MECQICGGKGDVVDSRPQGVDWWRRRQCRQCGITWTTVESAHPSDAAIKAAVAALVDGVRQIVAVQNTLKKMITRGGVG